MKNPDEAIDRVMAGLRDAQAPEGMEQRILQGMREQTMNSSHGSAARPWGWSLALASVVAAAVFAVWVHRARHDATESSARQAVANPVLVAPRVTHEIAVKTALPIKRSAHLKTRHVAAVDNDALAVSEMLAPSQPAPPVPLTEQEQLLRRVVRSSDPQELAMLEPEARAAQLEKEKAEVRRFFEPSIKNKGDKE